MITAQDIENLRIPIIIPAGGTTLEDLAARVVNMMLLVVGVVAFIYLLYAGILYITSGANTDQAKKAQSAFINVLIGIILVSLSYAIVRFVVSFVAGFGQ